MGFGIVEIQNFVSLLCQTGEFTETQCEYNNINMSKKIPNWNNDTKKAFETAKNIKEIQRNIRNDENNKVIHGTNFNNPLKENKGCGSWIILIIIMIILLIIVLIMNPNFLNELKGL